MSDTNLSVTLPVGTGLSRMSVIRRVTRDCLSAMSATDLENPEYVEGVILENINDAIEMENAVRPKGSKWRTLDALIPSQIADIMAQTYRIVNIVTSKDPNADTGLVALYQDEGLDKGIYSVDTRLFRQIARAYNYGLSSYEFEEVMNVLRLQVPEKTICQNRDMIAVNNGIFDYRNKVLLDFTPDMIFLSKSRVDFNVNATNVVIHNDSDNTDWDVESWMNDLSDDPEIVALLWQVIGAMVRPLVNWDKSAWFYSESGNNGKGTLCELMRQICGNGTYTSIPLSDFGKDFMLEPLTHASAIIVDENDVGTYIDKAANLKAVVTGDVIQINRKFKAPISYQFHGFMVQCLNEMPRIKDKSDSFYRRQIFVPFTKCFTGAERKYIKHDYLQRKEVLEYVLHKVLMMDYYELSTPEACRVALEEYKDFVDPVREFLKEHMDLFQWDLVPIAFLYDLYCAWYRATCGNDRNVKSRPMFIKDIRVLIDELYPDWEFPANSIRPIGRMTEPEPLIAEYHLNNWMNPLFASSTDVRKKCIPVLKPNYKGLLRRQATLLTSDGGSDTDIVDVVE